MAKKYEAVPYSRSYPTYSGAKTESRCMVTLNSKPIADCKTQKMAEKIIRGLKLVDEEERKRKEFRL